MRFEQLKALNSKGLLLSSRFAPRNVKFGALLFSAGLLVTGLCYRQGYPFGANRQTLATTGTGPAVLSEPDTSRVTKKQVAEAIGQPASLYRFPTEATLPGETSPAVFQYTFDAKLQESMEALMKSYKPDYGAFVAIDARTGRILSMVSYTEHKDITENLALRGDFPSASVFKVVTAAAAIEENHYSADTVVPFNGRNHTLYRSNILKDRVNRWTRHPSLKEAFANSINTVFAKIGAFTVGPEEMRNYADRFGFNRKITADFLIAEGHAAIPDDKWGLAAASSGFTRENTMSPLQGALIAAAIVNDGTMMEPYLVQSVHGQDGTELYAVKPKISNMTVDPKTAVEIRSLMRETITHGTARKSFSRFFRGDLADLQVGGKTGSLTGLNPRGKYDWFVGFADDGNRKIAVAALTIHERLWRVKSSYLARRAFEQQFKLPKSAPNLIKETEQLEARATPRHRRHRHHNRRLAKSD